MSGSRRCCCGNAEGCLRCETPNTFLGTPSINSWCGIVYGFTFTGLLPEIKSNYNFTDFALNVQSISGQGSGCEADTNGDGSIDTKCPGIIFTTVKFNGITFYYDINYTNIPNAGCTYDIMQIYEYRLDTFTDFIYALKFDRYNNGCPPPCGEQLEPEDVEAVLGPKYAGIIQHTNANFKCIFRACGFTPPTFLGAPFFPSNIPPKWTDDFDNVTTTANNFLVGVTLLNNADPFIIKSIQYAPVIRTIDDTIPIPTPDCLYRKQETAIPGSSNIPTAISKTCFNLDPEEECRCQSGLIIRLISNAEYLEQEIKYGPVYGVGQGGEPIELRVPYQPIGSGPVLDQNGNPRPPKDIGYVDLQLYYYGCIDDIIYGNTTPKDRSFILDGGHFAYKGLFKDIVEPPFTAGMREQTIHNINLVDLDEYSICPYRNYYNCPPFSFFNHSQYLTAGYILEKFNIPREIIVKRLS
jgi:hypothetical protein